jgi:hypothetical protein
MCKPQCHWVTDDPVSEQTCEPRCKPLQCTWRYDGAADTQHVCGTAAPSCTVQCAEDTCPSDSAPACEALCEAHRTNALCEIECDPMECGWLCTKPANPTPLRAELVCEHPAADVSDNLDEFSVAPGSQSSPPFLGSRLLQLGTLFIAAAVVVSIAMHAHAHLRRHLTSPSGATARSPRER